MINNIINIVKFHLLQYNFIEIDFEIQDNILLIDLHPRFKFIEFNKEIIDLIKLIEAELQEKNETKYRISVYNKFDYKEEKQQHDKDVKGFNEAVKVCNMLNNKKQDIVNILDYFNLDHFFKNTYYNGIVNYYIENKGNKSIINIYPVKGYVFKKDFDELIYELKKEFLKVRINKCYIFNTFYELEEYDKYVKQQHTFFNRFKTTFGLWKK